MKRHLIQRRGHTFSSVFLPGVDDPPATSASCVAKYLPEHVTEVQSFNPKTLRLGKLRPRTFPACIHVNGASHSFVCGVAIHLRIIDDDLAAEIEAAELAVERARAELREVLEAAYLRGRPLTHAAAKLWGQSATPEGNP
jgi:hypothetical protein